MIYLDYAATTPLLKEVEKAMAPYGQKFFANPRAIHGAGRLAKEAIEKARRSVARSLGVKKETIIFNAGGTEGNNQALAGVAEQYFLEKGKWPHVIISSLEHASVLETAQAIARRGGSFSVLPATKEGIVDVAALKNLLTPETAVVSMLLVQNELATIQPIKKIREVINVYKKELGKGVNDFPYLHVDATQAPRILSLTGLLTIADSYILDGSKIYGPKGTGVLVKRSTVRIAPVIWGGGQEGGFLLSLAEFLESPHWYCNL
jgi:cysteine desulfurase